MKIMFCLKIKYVILCFTFKFWNFLQSLMLVLYNPLGQSSVIFPVPRTKKCGSVAHLAAGRTAWKLRACISPRLGLFKRNGSAAKIYIFFFRLIWKFSYLKQICFYKLTVSYTMKKNHLQIKDLPIFQRLKPNFFTGTNGKWGFYGYIQR